MQRDSPSCVSSTQKNPWAPELNPMHAPSGSQSASEKHAGREHPDASNGDSPPQLHPCHGMGQPAGSSHAITGWGVQGGAPMSRMGPVVELELASLVPLAPVEVVPVWLTAPLEVTPASLVPDVAGPHATASKSTNAGAHACPGPPTGTL